MKTSNAKLNEQLVKDIHQSMDSNSTEDLIRIWEDNDRSEYSNEAFEAIRQLLVERGQQIPEQPPQKPTIEELKERRTLKIGADEELDHYVVEARGISRTKLNVFALIGLFIFGWLITSVFEYLGKKIIGWMYLICLLIMRIKS